MSLRDLPDYDQKLDDLKKIMEMRGDSRTDIDQRHLTVDGVLNRIEALQQSGVLNGKRVLMMGDSDLTGIAISIFGEPKEVVGADIDERLSEIYFEAMLEFDAAIRYLYHDMRIKIIAILRNQYSLVMLEPPRTVGGVETFLSRAIEIIEVGDKNHLFVNVPHNGEIRQYFDSLLETMGLSIIKIHEGINIYEDGSEPGDMVELKVTEESKPLFNDHYIKPFYENEVSLELQPYKCVCRETIMVGNGGEFENIEALEASGCPHCDYIGLFAFKSEIQLK